MNARAIKEEALAFAAKLDAHNGTDIRSLWQDLRRTDVPFVPILLHDDLPKAHALCGDILEIIGKANVGAAYALENHLYVLGGLETYLTLHPRPQLRERLDELLAQRHYLANTHAYTHSDRAFAEGIAATRTADGVALNGVGHFVSFANTADLLFITLVDTPDPVALLFAAKNDGITFGDFYFPNVLLESDTRSISCSDVQLDPDSILDAARDDMLPGGALSSVLLGWHLTLSASAFVGGAGFLIDQTVDFARHFKAFDGRLLARLDGVISAIGSIASRHGAAQALIRDYSTALRSICANASNHETALHDSHLRAQVANRHAMDLTHAIAHACSGIVGTRVFSADHAKFEKVLQELSMGPLLPRNNAILDKDIGHTVLARAAAPASLH